MSPYISNFQDYTNNILGNRIAESDIFNGYTTFLMCNRNNREDIRRHRMNWMITNFVTYNCDADAKKDLKDLRDVYKDFYERNVEDTYSGHFDPPGCFYNYVLKLDDMEREKYLKECEERYNDDIETHYRDISNRYNVVSRIETLSDDEYDDVYESDDYDTGYITQSDIIDEYDDYEYFDDYYEETEIEDDYNDW